MIHLQAAPHWTNTLLYPGSKGETKEARSETGRYRTGLPGSCWRAHHHLVDMAPAHVLCQLGSEMAGSPSALIDQQPTKLVLLARLTSWINSCKHELDRGLVQLLTSQPVYCLSSKVREPRARNRILWHADGNPTDRCELLLPRAPSAHSTRPQTRLWRPHG